jgi:hypothetical protein
MADREYRHVYFGASAHLSSIVTILAAIVQSNSHGIATFEAKAWHLASSRTKSWSRRFKRAAPPRFFSASLEIVNRRWTTMTSFDGCQSRREMHRNVVMNSPVPQEVYPSGGALPHKLGN